MEFTKRKIQMKKYYIAYGSNLNVQQMKFRCPTARVVGTSVIRNYELLYKGSKTGSYLTIEKKVQLFRLQSGKSQPMMKKGLMPMKVFQTSITRRT